MRLVFSRPASADLREIDHWISVDNPHRAFTFVEELRQSCRDLLAFPRAYPIDHRYLPNEIRHRSHGRYIIFYRIGTDRLTIIGIVHSARDVEPIIKHRLS